MKRAATFVAILATMFGLAAAPGAVASHAAAVHADSAVLGPGGSVIVSGTVACVEGYRYIVSTTIRQRAGQQYNTAMDSFFGLQGTCAATGPQRYSSGPLFGQGPFHPGPASVSSSATVCDSFSWFSDCAGAQDLREVRIAA